jgi:ribokinase
MPRAPEAPPAPDPLFYRGAMSSSDARPAVLVVGSVNSDTIIRCPRIAAPGHTVTGTGLELREGGKGANQAVAAARLGARVQLVARVGIDPAGDRARAALAAEGVGTAWVGRDPQTPTGVAVVLVDDAAENAITVAPGANATLTPAHVESAAEALLASGVRVGVLLTGLEVPLPAVQRAAELAAAHGWRFLLNPSPARRLPDALLAACDVLVPNEHEAHAVHPDGVPGALAAGARAVLVTRGAHGAVLHRPGAEPVPYPAFPVTPIDTTGAGDAFAGTLAWSLTTGHPLPAAIPLALAAGALATRATGARTAFATSAEVTALAATGP